ncbi:hypothetical protein BWI17_18285 [Betaproteobacteria bacterium GR16-43]|nr:hypothetical protein BWI17_18285 [Betaproteobacteria bacterium GR16-43]
MIRSILFALGSALAASSALAEWSLRLTKAPETKGWEKPAIASYTRSDGGESAYMTQGSVGYSFAESQPFGVSSKLIPSARLSWAKNTLAGQEQDTRSGTLDLQLDFAAENPQNFVTFAASLGGERNELKSSEAWTASLDILAGWDPLFSPVALQPVAFAIVPGAGYFVKDVRDAPTDAQTGITPTGKLRGYYVNVTATLIPNFLTPIASQSEFFQASRWRLVGTAQNMRTTDVLPGDEKGSHRLYTIALNYSFADPVVAKPSGPAQLKLIPGITLRRQVGSDPWNDIAKGGFTQLAFSLKY